MSSICVDKVFACTMFLSEYFYSLCRFNVVNLAVSSCRVLLKRNASSRREDPSSWRILHRNRYGAARSLVGGPELRRVQGKSRRGGRGYRGRANRGEKSGSRRRETATFGVRLEREALERGHERH